MARIAIACAAAVLSGGTLSAVAAAGIVLLAAKAGTDKQKMDLAWSVR